MKCFQVDYFKCSKLQTEATYDVVMSAWNPIDGWVSSKPSKMEVLARVGPITIDDYLIVSDSVRIFNILDLLIVYIRFLLSNLYTDHIYVFVIITLF